jgi:hypothetical protein
MAHRPGRAVLLANRMDWTAEQVVAAYSGQQRSEQVFRDLNDGDWPGWGPMQSLHRKSQDAWRGLSVEHVLTELDQIKQFVLLYPGEGAGAGGEGAEVGRARPRV